MQCNAYKSPRLKEKEMARAFENRQQISKQKLIDNFYQSIQWRVEAVLSQPGC